MTEQMNVPKLRFGEFDTQWKPIPLGEVTSYLKGFAFKSEDYLSSGQADSRLIRVSDLSSASVKLDNQKVFLPPELVASSTKYKLQDGDVLITTVGSKPELRESAVGRAIYINKAHGYLNQNLLIMRTKSEQSPKFIFSQLNTPRYINHITNIQRGNANQSNITVVDLFEYRVSTTSLSEQQKIASFLSKVDEKITLLTEKKDKLTEYKKGVMQQLFNGKWEEQDGQLIFIPPTLRFKADDGSEFPDWEEKKLGDVLTIGNGRDYKHLSDGDIPVFGTGGYMTSVDGYLYDGETVFIGRKGTINKPYMFNGKFWTVDTLFYTKDFKDILPKFVYAIFQKVNWSLYNEATGVPSLSKSTINKIRLNVPSLSEQEKITEFISSLDQKIDLVNEELEKAKEWKKGLLQQMFV